METVETKLNLTPGPEAEAPKIKKPCGCQEKSNFMMEKDWRISNLEHSIEHLYSKLREKEHEDELEALRNKVYDLQEKRENDALMIFFLCIFAVALIWYISKLEFFEF